MTVPFCGWFAPQSNNNTAAARWHTTRLQTRGLRGFHADYASIMRLPVRAASRNLISICPRVRTARHGFRPGAHPRALRGLLSARYQLPRRKLPRRKLPRETSARRRGTSEQRGVSQLGRRRFGARNKNKSLLQCFCGCNLCVRVPDRPTWGSPLTHLHQDSRPVAVRRLRGAALHA